MKLKRFCKLKECDTKHFALGYCEFHYRRFKRTGLTYRSKLGQHGRDRSDGTYSSWSSMKTRCLDESSSIYGYYGGRGIAIHPSWLGPEGFVTFLKDMGERPKGMTIDRIDVDGNYEPSNCKWASRLEQSNNRRSNVTHTINGVTKNVKQWSDFYHVDAKPVYARLKRGKTIQEALGIDI